MNRQRVVLLSVILITVLVNLLAAPRPVLAQTIVRFAIPEGGSTTGECLSWAEGCTLTRAIAAAADGEEVWVKTGTYKPTETTDRKISFNLKNGVAIYGGFAGSETTRASRRWAENITTLSGDIGALGISTDNSHHVVYGSGLNSTAILDGFTITRGNANGTLQYYYGGGIYLTASSPTLTNLRIIANTTTGNGGGMYLMSSSPTLTHVTFIGNSAPLGGAIHNRASSPVLTNVTITANITTNLSSGAISNYENSMPQIRSSIIYFNLYSSQVVNNSSSAVITFSDVERGSSSNGNIHANPLFVRDPNPGADVQWGTADDDYGDLRPQPISPAINSGDGTLTIPEVDLAGQPRVMESGVDMGAYESQQPSNHAPVLSGSFPSLAMLQDPTTIPDITVGPLLSGHVSDADGNAAEAGMGVYAADMTNGMWEYSLDDGTTWLVMEDITDTTGLLLGPTARLRFLPNAAWNGTAVLSFRAWDRTNLLPSGSVYENISATGYATPYSAESGTLVAVVASGFNAPVLNPIGNKVVDEENQLAFTATVYTPPEAPPTTLIYTLDVNAPEGASIHPDTGAFTWTPTEDQGPEIYFISVRVTNNAEPPASSSETIQVTVNEVNEKPVLSAIGNKAIQEGARLSFSTLASDSDDPANTLTFSLDQGAPEEASINPASGAFGWTTTEAQGGSIYSITIRVTDSGTPPQSASETIQVTVQDINAAPVLGAIGNKTVKEGESLDFTASAADSDLPANTLTFTLDEGAPEGASINAASGNFTWMPTEAQGPGTYPITVRVTDNGAQPETDSETIQVTVEEANANPKLSPIGNQSLKEGQVLSLALSADDSLDIPANTISYAVSGLPAGANYQLNQQTGAFTWSTTEAEGPMTYSLTIIITDDGFPAASTSETIQVTVEEVNEPPSLPVIGNRIIDEEKTLAFSAAATDPDLPANTLTYSLSSDAPQGASINPGTGAFHWLPSEAQGPGDYTFTITAADNYVPALTDSETITVSVNDVNVAPQAFADHYTATQGRLLSINATQGVLANDSDHEATPLTAVLVTPPSHGAFSLHDDGSFEYTPEPDYSSSNDIFIYRASDGQDTSAIVIVSIFVNTIPVVQVNEPQAVNEGEPVNFSALVTDPDGAPESWEVHWDFGDGTNLTGGINTSHVYQDNGAYTVTATVTDTYDASDTGGTQVAVANVAPEINSMADVWAQVGQSFQLARSFTDPGALDNHTVEITWETGVTETINLAAGVLDFSIPHTYTMFGTYDVLVQVADKDGGTDAYTVKVHTVPYRVMLPMVIK